MAKAKEQKYVVTQPNTLDHKVGDVISLTEERAAILVNKVRLKDDSSAGVADNSKEEIAKLTKDNAKLSTETQTLQATIKGLDAKVAELEGKLTAKK